LVWGFPFLSKMHEPSTVFKIIVLHYTSLSFFHIFYVILDRSCC
jgi:hypothetical protein